MRSLKEVIDNSIIKESKCTNIAYPRKGNDLYILCRGEDDVTKVKVEAIAKKPMGKGYEGSYFITAVLSSNRYGIESFTQSIFKSIDYKSHPDQVEVLTHNNQTYYIGVSEKSVVTFAKQAASNSINNVIQKIEKLEKELADLYKEKETLELTLNIEVSESLK